jgi:hypothetical protein
VVDTAAIVGRGPVRLRAAAPGDQPFLEAMLLLIAATWRDEAAGRTLDPALRGR